MAKDKGNLVFSGHRVLRAAVFIDGQPVRVYATGATVNSIVGDGDQKIAGMMARGRDLEVSYVGGAVEMYVNTSWIELSQRSSDVANQ